MPPNRARRPPPPSARRPRRSSLLDQIISEGRLARDEEQRALAKDLIGEFVEQVMAGTMTVSKDTQTMINAADRRRSTSCSPSSSTRSSTTRIPEARGLLARAALLRPPDRDGHDAQDRVLNVSKKDLLKDLERAAEFDQSALFKKVYEEEYGTFGGAPFGALVGDYEFTRHPQDIALLEKISNVAAAAHAAVHLRRRARSCSTGTTSPRSPARAT